jgi:hypothetical protein
MARLRDARLQRKSDDEVAQARQALLAARLQSQQAHQAARQQGSGAPGDRPRVPAERGSLVDVFA